MISVNLNSIMIKFLVLAGMSVIVLVPVVYVLYKDVSVSEEDTCSSIIGNDVTDSIASYQTVVNAIVDAALNGDFNNVTWDQLSIFIDTFGNRISGSAKLERAIDYMLNLSDSFDLENVHGENVSVPNWIRFVIKGCHVGGVTKA